MITMKYQEKSPASSENARPSVSTVA